MNMVCLHICLDIFCFFFSPQHFLVFSVQIMYVVSFIPRYFLSNSEWYFIIDFCVWMVTASIYRNKIEFYMLILCPSALIFCSGPSSRLLPCLLHVEVPHYPPLYLLSLFCQAASCSPWTLASAWILALLRLLFLL